MVQTAAALPLNSASDVKAVLEVVKIATQVGDEVRT